MKKQFLFILMALAFCGCHKTNTAQNVTPQTNENIDTISVDKYEIDSTFWIQYSDGSHLRAADTFFIRELQTAVAKGDKKHIAGMIYYPFERSYPLKPIANESEFIANYNSLLPAHIRERIIQSELTDWATVGWRGTMLDNGLLWFTDFDIGTKIRCIYYDDKQQKQKMINQEREWIGFNKNETPSFCLLAHDSSLVAYVTYDSTANDWYNYHVRMYHRSDSFKHPYINTVCKQDHGGSAGNISLSALVDSLLIEVWYCFDECEIDYACGFAVVDKNLPQEELDYYPADSVVEMTPVYLRDVVKWW